MSIQLFGSPTNLQGNTSALQGGYNPQTTVNPVAPQPVPQPVAPQPVAAAPRTTVPKAVAPTVPTAQPIQINPSFSQYVQTRPSASNPGVLEYYNPQNGIGFSSPNDVFNYLRTQTGQAINSLNELSAPQNNQYTPQYGVQYQPAQPAQPTQPNDPNQAYAQSAGLGGLSFEDYQKIISGTNGVSQAEKDQIRQSLGIPDLQNSIFTTPSKSTTQLFNDAYASAGLAELKAQIAAKTKAVNDLQAQYTNKGSDVNENPFLSEASRTGRLRVLDDKRLADVGNINTELNSLKDLYNSGLNEVGSLVTRQTTDFSNNQQLNAQKLDYLTKQAEEQITNKQSEKSATAYKYLPDYLKAKAQAAKPDTIELNDGSLVSYDKTTGTFVTVRGANAKPVDPLESAYKALQIQKLQQYIATGGNANELLSVGDAQSLGVPYGTTKGQAVQQGITPTKAPSDAQNQAAGFALRVQQSASILDNLESSIQSYNPIGFEAQLKLPSFAQSGNIQSYDQAARNFVNAVLRRESGAAISTGEFQNAYQQYLPRPGDSSQVLDQKKQNRTAVLNSLVNSSGSSYNNLTGGSSGNGFGSASDPLGLFGEKGGGAVLTAVNTKYPDGTVGGQCGTFAHKIADFPSVGNQLSQKQATVNNSGVTADVWRQQGAKVGDVIISNYPPYGHVEVVVAVQPNGKLVTKGSNFNDNEKVSTRTIDINNSKIYGVLRGTLKIA